MAYEASEEDQKLKAEYMLAHKISCVLKAAKEYGSDFDAMAQLAELQAEAKSLLLTD